MSSDVLQPTRSGIGRNPWICLITGLAAVATYYLLPADMNELSRRTATIFLVAAVFWATEVMPLYATSLCIIGLEILFLATDGGLAAILPARSEMPIKPGGSDYLQFGVGEFLKSFASPIIMLFLGGFLLSAAVSKHGIDRVIAGRLIRPFTKRPKTLIFVILGITGFFSMWMSNTATTAMMLAIIAPIVRALDSKDKFHRAIILAVPFGANVGGIGTPIGTPPNAVALAALRMGGYQVGFVDWMIFAVPLMLILLVVTGVVLIWFFPPAKGLVLPETQAPQRITLYGKLSIFILCTAILLWLTGKWHGLDDAAVALLAAAALTAFRVLDRRDVDSIDWNVLILMWGGLSLGHAMSITGLVSYFINLPIIGTIQAMPGLGGQLVLAGFVVFVAIALSTFMSNTAAAALIVPMAMALSPSEGGMLAILCAFACSFAMAMPVSTPPNAMAFASGTIPAASMLRSGGVIGIISILVLVSGHRVVLPMFLASASSGDQIMRRVAVLVPTSGERAEAGQTQMEGYEFAAETLRRSGIEVRFFDTGAVREPVGELLEREVRPWTPDVIVGPYHSEAAIQLSGAMTANDAPLIVPTANVDRLTQRATGGVFRLAPPMQVMAMTLGDFVVTQREAWKLSHVVVMHEAGSFGKDVAQAVAGACLMRGIEIATPISFPVGDVASITPKLGDGPPEQTLMVFVARSSEDARALIAKFAPTGVRMVGFTGGFATLSTRELLNGTVVEPGRLFVVTPWNASGVETAFVEAFEKQFNTKPSYRAAQAAAALMVAGRAIDEARTQKRTPQAMLQSQVFQTQVGPVRFIDFGGYYRQNPASAVIINVTPDRTERVWGTMQQP